MSEGVDSVEESAVASGAGATLRPLSEAELTDDVIRGLVDAAPDGLVMVDEQGRILLVNRQAEEIFGYDRGELLGLPVETLIPPALRRGHTAHRTRYRVDPRVRNMGAGLDLRGYRKDDTEFPVEISLSPLRTGGQLRVIAAVRDITDRKATEARAREIQDVLDATPDAILIFDPESLGISYANRGAIAHLGYSRDELLGMTPLHFKPDISESRFRAMVAALRDKPGSATTYTTLHRRKDGTDIPVEAILQSAIPDDDGQTRLMVSVVRDISERLESEERLREAQAELGTLEDRERIARDLHDTVIQRLFAAGLTLQGTASRVRDAEVASRLEDVVDQLDETIRELRSAIFGLEGRGSGAGLRVEISRVAADERDGLGFDPKLVIEGSLEAISDDVAAQLLPTLRESLSNVARHANATAAEVHLRVGPDVRLTVIDDGRGFGEEVSNGKGLQNMESRAKALGGSMRVSPGTPSGTVLVWAVPLDGGVR
jgi:PAS domain S-box-containing protein